MSDLTITRTPYAIGETTGLPAHLEANEQELETAIEALDTNQAVIEDELHGIGTVLDPASDTVMQAGSGLSVQVLNQAVYVDGRRYPIDEGPGWLVVSVPSVQTSHIYLDKDGAETVLDNATYPDPQAAKPAGTWYVGQCPIDEGPGWLVVSVPSVQTSHIYLDKDGAETVLDNATYPDPQAAKPAGTWYVGQCTTDATDVTAVDFSACDHIGSIAATQTLAEELQVDIGTPYDEGTLGTVKVRLAALEGGGPGPAVYWGALEETAIDPTTVQQAIDAGNAAALAVAVDQAAAVLESENWDEDAVNQLETTVRLVHLAPEFAGSVLGVNDRYRQVVLVPGIMGHLYTGDPNGLLDESVSDMTRVDYTNHRFG